MKSYMKGIENRINPIYWYFPTIHIWIVGNNSVTIDKFHYPVRAVYSPEPDLGKAIVQTLSAGCTGLYRKSTDWILMKFRLCSIKPL